MLIKAFIYLIKNAEKTLQFLILVSHLNILEYTLFISVTQC